MLNRRRLGATAATGFAVFVAGAIMARRPAVTRLERRAFAAANELPHGLHPPVWLVMQLGSLGGVAAVTSVLVATNRRSLGMWAGLWGTVTWITAKGVKRFVRRERPAAVLGAARHPGAGAERPRLSVGPRRHRCHPRHRPGATCAGALGGRSCGRSLLTVGGARVFVGAHLPLDIVGGVGLGVGIGATGRLLARPVD